MMKSAWLLVVFAGIFIQPEASAQRMKVDSYDVRFTIRNAGIDVDGSVRGLEADIQFSPANLAESSIRATVDVPTITTGIALRDKHLQGREYFDSQKYPRIKMNSGKISALSKKNFSGVFLITIRDKTKEVVVPFTYSKKGSGFLLRGSFELNRLDFGIGTESIILSDTVVIEIDVVVSPAEKLTATE